MTKGSGCLCRSGTSIISAIAMLSSFPWWVPREKGGEDIIYNKEYNVRIFKSKACIVQYENPNEMEKGMEGTSGGAVESSAGGVFMRGNYHHHQPKMIETR